MRPPPPGVAHAFFSTPLGDCGLAWTSRGLGWFQLPEASPVETRARLSRINGDSPESAPPPWVRDAIDRVTRLLAGHDEDLSGIPVDLDRAPPFFRRVYEASRRIPRGRVWTYTELAAAAGSPHATRAVGQAMARNPLPVVVPCHRVVASGGRPGGFSAPGGLDTKARLLAIEGALVLTQLSLKTRAGAP
jgi:methylated-DNA-[protein]-cysteine S-methyltransferase